MYRTDVFRKQLNLLLAVGVLGLALVFSTAVSAAAQICAKATKPSAEFEKVWVDYDITENNERGLRIHLKFAVCRMKNIDSAIRVYFEGSNGKRLRDRNNRYSVAGDVVTSRSLKIDYDPGYYEDLVLFMPYNEFDVDPGKHNLKMDIDLVYGSGELVQHLAFYDFVYTKPALTTDTKTTTKTGPAAVQKIWVDYGVTEKGQLGMRIHVNFEVTGLKDTDCYLRVRVQKGDDVLMSATNEYSNADGQLVVGKYLTPGYEKTVYEDAQLFLPYSEILLPKGVHKLDLDLDLIKPNGDLIQHLDLYAFEFTNN